VALGEPDLDNTESDTNSFAQLSAWLQERGHDQAVIGPVWIALLQYRVGNGDGEYIPLLASFTNADFKIFITAAIRDIFLGRCPRFESRRAAAFWPTCQRFLLLEDVALQHGSNVSSRLEDQGCNMLPQGSIVYVVDVKQAEQHRRMRVGFVQFIATGTNAMQNAKRQHGWFTWLEQGCLAVDWHGDVNAVVSWLTA
jgi:hypothetical protein